MPKSYATVGQDPIENQSIEESQKQINPLTPDGRWNIAILQNMTEVLKDKVQ